MDKICARVYHIFIFLSNLFLFYRRWITFAHFLAHFVFLVRARVIYIYFYISKIFIAEKIYKVSVFVSKKLTFQVVPVVKKENCGILLLTNRENL